MYINDKVNIDMESTVFHDHGFLAYAIIGQIIA